MADNTTASAGSTLATDDIGGVHYQRVKITYGVDGTATDVSDTNRLPVVQRIAFNRVDRNFILDTWTAAPVADTLMSVIQWYGNAAVAATATPAVVPAGKILRLTGGRIETKSLATVGSVVMRIRAQAGGVATISSPIVASIGCGTRAAAGTTAATGGLDHQVFTFGDAGHQLPAGTGVGFSLAGYGPTGTLTLQGVTRFEVWGYEYTA